MQVEIATAEASDLARWLDLAAEVEPLFGPLVGNAEFEDALQRCIREKRAFCVRRDDGPAGAAVTGGLLFSSKPPLYRIGWLAVTAQARRQGVGRALVEHVERFVQPPAEMLVNTFREGTPGGEPARLFYQAMGFAPGEASEMPDGRRVQVFRRTFK